MKIMRALRVLGFVALVVLIAGGAAYRAGWLEPFVPECAEAASQPLFKDSMIEYGRSSSGVVGTYITLLSIDKSRRAVLGHGLGAPFPVGETQLTPEELATVQRTIEGARFNGFQSCYGRRAQVNPQNSWMLYRWGAREKQVVWMSDPADPKPPEGWFLIVEILDQIKARAEKQAGSNPRLAPTRPEGSHAGP